MENISFLTHFKYTSKIQLKIDHTEPGQSHDLIEKEFNVFVKFIRGDDFGV